MKREEKNSEKVSRIEAERRGAFAETALSEQDALDSVNDEADKEQGPHGK